MYRQRSATGTILGWNRGTRSLPWYLDGLKKGKIRILPMMMATTRVPIPQQRQCRSIFFHSTGSASNKYGSRSRNKGMTSVLEYPTKHQYRSKTTLQYNTATTTQTTNTTTKEDEVQKFSKLSDQWWNPQRNPLIAMNPIRIQFIQQCIQQYYSCHHSSTSTTARTADKDTSHQQQQPSLIILDVGCGGGLLSESLLRFGTNHTVVGIDPSQSLIHMARYHAQQTLSQQQLQHLHYYNTTLQDYVISSSVSSSSSSGTTTTDHHRNDNAKDPTDDETRKFDIVCCLEVIEHVPNYTMELLQPICQQLLRNNGLLFISTINPTFLSYAVTILGAEYITGLLPIGTHTWSQYVAPATVRQQLQSIILSSSSSSMSTSISSGLNNKVHMIERSVCGMVIPYQSLPATIVYNQWDWQLDGNNTDMNWIGCYQKTRN
jgi:2-polyprenyl-6-hydroxyphenyl methylase / 3-demethylubiquinone-9 3-methyltransferase